METSTTGREIECRCGVRLHFSHAGWVRRCPHCGEDLSGSAVAGPPPAERTAILAAGEPGEPEGGAPPMRSLGHFDLVECLGRGGMGFVYLAYDTSLDRRVAVKTLVPELARDPVVLSRFYNEARATARINHRNVVAVHYVGCSGGQPFFAMEYVEGTTLAQRLEAGRIPASEALEIVLAAARGLEAAHARGLVHRDVKPSNLLLAKDGTVKLVDFGLAKSLALESELSSAGTIIGTPAYLSPEQAAGKAVDARSDIYSLGVTFYHLLAGTRPFEDRTPVRLLSAHLERDPEPIEERMGDCPPRMARAVHRMMEKDPARRHASCRELIEELEACRLRPLRQAGLWSRTWATLLDVVVLTGTFSLLLVLAYLGVRIANAARADALVAQAMASRAWTPIQAVLEAGFALGVIGYFSFCHARWGRTLGKKLFELEVVDRWGDRPGARRSLARALALYLTIGEPAALLGGSGPIDALGSLLFLASLVLVGWKRRAVHDYLAGTRVVFR